MDSDWDRGPNLAIKVLALLITCCVIFVFRHKFESFFSTYTTVYNWLGAGLIILLIGITLYYS